MKINLRFFSFVIKCALVKYHKIINQINSSEGRDNLLKNNVVKITKSYAYLYKIDLSEDNVVLMFRNFMFCFDKYNCKSKNNYFVYRLNNYVIKININEHDYNILLDMYLDVYMNTL